jgi:hypothetical protein
VKCTLMRHCEWSVAIAAMILIAGNIPASAGDAVPSIQDCVTWQWCVYEGANGDPKSQQCRELYPDAMDQELANEAREPPKPKGMVFEAFCTKPKKV